MGFSGHSALFVTALATLVTCTPRELAPPVHRGPVVLITIDTLRADVVGALAGAETPEGQRHLTPHLDRFAAEADWAQPAVATSSWTVPSMASIMTGLQPWRHGNWHGERAVLQESQRTLAEAMQQEGFRTYGFRSNTWLRPKFGYAQGFDEWYDLGGSRRAIALLESLGPAPPREGGAAAEEGEPEAPSFVWIHVLPPHAPYLRHDEFLERLHDGAQPNGNGNFDELANLPNRVTAAQLEPFLDPSVALDDATRRKFWALYRLHVSHADRIVGELLDALRRSPGWNDALVAITSDHGEEFGEAGQIAHGGNLHRVLLEVPLLLKLPQRADTAGAGRALEVTPRAGVSNARLFATLVEAVGGDAGEALDSLFVDRAPRALSELYAGNGDNRFSLVEPVLAEGGRAPSPDAQPGAAQQALELQQVHWTSRFAASEEEYFAARTASLHGELLASGESPDELFQRQSEAFLLAPPLAGALDSPDVEVRAWGVDPRHTPLIEAPLAAAASRLRETWLLANGVDRSPADLAAAGEIGPGQVELLPAERERLKALGYVVR